MDNHETKGLLEKYNAMTSADWGVNFCMLNETIRTITHRRMPSGQYEPHPFSETLRSLIVVSSSRQYHREYRDALAGLRQRHRPGAIIIARVFDQSPPNLCKP
jgi:hypothetical protein